VTATTVLSELHRAGVQVRLTPEGLVVTPRSAFDARLRRLVVRHKADLVATLDPEVGWRVNAMRQQVTGSRALPLLVARTVPRFSPGRCLSCGDPAKDAEAGYSRCAACRTAAGLVAFEVVPARQSA